jgi:hypothetical protein
MALLDRIGGTGVHQRHSSCGFASETLADLLREFDGRGSGCGNVLRQRNQRDYGLVRVLQTLDKVCDAVCFHQLRLLEAWRSLSSFCRREPLYETLS